MAKPHLNLISSNTRKKPNDTPSYVIRVIFLEDRTSRPPKLSLSLSRVSESLGAS
jgi:hypothetical protein